MKKLIDSSAIEIDAKNISLGRLAAKIAYYLLGKDRPDYQRHMVLNRKTIVYNASQFKLTGSKFKNKKYYKFTGYLGKLKSKSLAEIYQVSPADVLIRSVKKMLPKNRLLKERIHNLIIKK